MALVMAPVEPTMRNLIYALFVVAVGCGDDDPAVGNSDVDTGSNVETRSDATVDTGVTETTADSAADSAPDDTAADSADVSAETVADTVDPVDTSSDTGVADTVETTDTAAETETVVNTCSSPDDCALCAFGSKVESAADCYCVFCATIPMLASECAANTASWNQFCNPWPGPGVCPVASCIPVPAPLCEAGKCVADRNGCFGPQDCGACSFTRPPETPEDCRCPGCPQPLANDYCAEIEQAIADVCFDFDYDACQPPPCAFPPPIECGQDWTCGYGERLPAEPE